MLSYLEYAIVEAAELHENFNSSLVMKYLYGEINSIPEKDLSPELTLKKKHLKKLCELVGHLPIQDAHNFKKVYDMYKVKEVDFN